MIDASAVYVGQHVHYQPEHYKKDGKFENGVIKEIRVFDDGAIGVWVVYNCAGNWEEYYKYTSARTAHSDLFYGWA